MFFLLFTWGPTCFSWCFLKLGYILANEGEWAAEDSPYSFSIYVQFIVANSSKAFYRMYNIQKRKALRQARLWFQELFNSKKDPWPSKLYCSIYQLILLPVCYHWLPCAGDKWQRAQNFNAFFVLISTYFDHRSLFSLPGKVFNQDKWYSELTSFYLVAF